MTKQPMLFDTVPEIPQLTVLSFGGGQDSTAILYMLAFDKEFRREYAPNDLVVIMADTGNEHPETKEHVYRTMSFCKHHGIEFFLVGLDENTPASWRDGLVGFYELKNTCGSKTFRKTCTDNLKIRPIYNFLEQYIPIKYGVVQEPRKKTFYKFASRGGRVRVLLGIAKGEEKRAGTNEQSVDKWMREAIDKKYPLIDLGMDRQACQDKIKEYGMPVPMPSNCILCPFLNHIELLWLYRFMPKWYDKWVKLERNKIENFRKRGQPDDKNYGVWGKKLLPEVLEEAIEKYGHMSDDELQEYKMSHGHCVMSKY